MQPPLILAISSFVAHGTVGLRAIGPALRSTGCTPIEVPSILLSNHPGQGRIAGQTIDPALIKEILQTLEANGWLAEVSAVLSGYLPTPAHVDAMRAAVEHVKRLNPAAIYVCDPILGDALYRGGRGLCDPRHLVAPRRRRDAQSIRVVLAERPARSFSA